MPELPEVEVVRRGLEAHVVGRRLTSVEVLHPRPVRRHLAGAEDFAAADDGRLVLGAARRGQVPLAARSTAATRSWPTSG